MTSGAQGFSLRARLQLQRSSAAGLDLLAGQPDRVQRHHDRQPVHRRTSRAPRCCRRSARCSRSTTATARSIRTPVICSRWAPTSPASAATSHFVRTSLNGSYYIPLDTLTGNTDWGIKLAAGAGYLFNLAASRSKSSTGSSWAATTCAASRTGGAGPHDAISGDPLGGRFIWTHRPSCASRCRCRRDLGLTGRAFVDVGGLTEASFNNLGTCNGGEWPVLRDRPVGRAAHRRRRRHLLEHAVRADQY